MVHDVCGVLHVLEDSLQGSPTWSVHELHAEGGVVGRGEGG